MNKTRRIPFYKLQGAGNDFVFLDRSETKIPVSKEIARRMLDRHFGVGGDQLVVLTPGTSVTPARLEFFNSDGSKAEMCGNGTRAAALYLREFKGVRNDFEFKTAARLIPVKFRGGRIEVDMGEPIWDGPKIPVKARGEVIGRPTSVRGNKFLMNCVSMGNPHCVIFVKNVKFFPVREIGQIIENQPFFPQRVNVEFVQVLNSSNLKVRVWERGAGETLACGSGACAVAAVGAKIGRTGKRLRLELPGGVLETRISADNHVHLTGPAEIVFRGTFLI